MSLTYNVQRTTYNVNEALKGIPAINDTPNLEILRVYRPAYCLQIMSNSLEITRDQNGYFRHRDGYPLVVIFDSKDAEDKTPNAISWQEPVIGTHTHKPKDSVSEPCIRILAVESDRQHRHPFLV